MLQHGEYVNLVEPSKNSADKELVFDLINKMDQTSPSHLILVTGDGDFKPLVSLAQKAGIQVTVIGNCYNSNSKLKEVAYQFYSLHDYIQMLKESQNQMLKESQKEFPESLEYETCLQYIKKSIDFLMQQNMKTTFATVGQFLLMELRKLPQFQNCKKLPPIIKEKTRFSGLKKIVTVANTEGKLIIKDEQIFWIYPS